MSIACRCISSSWSAFTRSLASSSRNAWRATNAEELRRPGSSTTSMHSSRARLGQVDQLHVAALGELADGRRHHLVAALAMMPEGLAVHRYRKHFIVLAPLREAGLEAAEQIVAAAQGLAEGDRARDRAVVEEDGKGGAGGQANEVRSRRIEARADHVQPLAARG